MAPSNGDSDNGEIKKQRGRPPKPEALKKAPKAPSSRGRGRPPLSEEEKQARMERKKSASSFGAGRGRPRGSLSPKKKKKIMGRPRKIADDQDDQEEERRPIGRPNTGAEKLNIVATGKGQGRPKAVKRKSNTSENGVAKKRGRPSKGGKAKVPKTSSGRGRGRPKGPAKQDTEESNEEEVKRQSEGSDSD